MGMCEDEMWKRRRRKGDIGFFLKKNLVDV